MAETSTHTDSRLEKMASRAAERAYKKAKVESDIDIPDQFSAEDVDNLVSSTPDDAADDISIGFDLFDYCDKLQKNQGHQISYVVKRNGEMLTVKYHPYTWERIQKEYGAGQYQIIAKSLTTKRYLKQETRVIADTEENWRNNNKEQQVIHIPAPPPPPGIDFKEMFLMMNQMQERQRQEAREQSKEAAKMQENQMMAMVEMMKTSSNQSSQMFLEVAKMTQTVSEKLASSQAQMFEKMETRFERVIDKLGNNKVETPSINPFEILKMTKDAEESGFNRMAQLLTFARAEAEERYSDRDERQPKAEKKSLTDTLIESMLPTITTALTGQAFGQGTPVAKLPQQVRRVLPQTRPAIPAKAATGNQTTGNNQAPRETNPQTQSNAKSRVINGIGLPSVSFDEVPLSKQEVLPTITEIEEWLAPIVGECLFNRVPVEQASPTVIDVLKNRGLSKENFCKIMSESSMIALVTKYGLPEEATDWFKGVYANISSTTGASSWE
jgi:hypothetical protein